MHLFPCSRPVMVHLQCTLQLDYSSFHEIIWIMPRYLRWRIAGATYFFTVVTYQRRPLFEHANLRRFLGASFRHVRRRLPFEVDAIVLLSDHLHILMRPADGVDYSHVWRRIKTVFSSQILANSTEKQGGASNNDAPYWVSENGASENDAPYWVSENGASENDAPYADAKAQRGNARRDGEANVWQRRFYEHTIRDEDDWGRHVDYIHWNPVKHGLVKRPQDWKWSSIHRYISNGLLVPDWPDGNELNLPNVRE